MSSPINNLTVQVNNALTPLSSVTNQGILYRAAQYHAYQSACSKHIRFHLATFAQLLNLSSFVGNRCDTRCVLAVGTETLVSYLEPLCLNNEIIIIIVTIINPLLCFGVPIIC